MSIYTVYADSAASREVRDAVQLLARIKSRPLIELADTTMKGRSVNIQQLGLPLYNGVSILAFGCGLFNERFGNKAHGVRMISFLDDEHVDMKDIDGIVHREKGRTIGDMFQKWLSKDAGVHSAMVERSMI